MCPGVVSGRGRLCRRPPVGRRRQHSPGFARWVWASPFFTNELCIRHNTMGGWGPADPAALLLLQSRDARMRKGWGHGTTRHQYGTTATLTDTTRHETTLNCRKQTMAW